MVHCLVLNLGQCLWQLVHHLDWHWEFQILGPPVGSPLGLIADGAGVGSPVGPPLGDALGATLVAPLGLSFGLADGAPLGKTEGLLVRGCSAQELAWVGCDAPELEWEACGAQELESVVCDAQELDSAACNAQQLGQEQHNQPHGSKLMLSCGDCVFGQPSMCDHPHLVSTCGNLLWSHQMLHEGHCLQCIQRLHRK